MLFNFDTISDFSGILAVYGIILLFSSGIGLVTYIFKSIGLYKMAKNLNLSNAWMAWVPILSTYTFGKIGSKYVKNDGKPSAKFGGWLLGLEISMVVLAIGMCAVIIGMIPNLIMLAESDFIAPSTELVGNFAAVFGFWFILVVIGIAYSVVYYVALWRVFAIFDNSTATVFLIVSILFSIATPFLIFAIRNNRPALTFADRAGFVPPAAEPNPEFKSENQDANE